MLASNRIKIVLTFLLLANSVSAFPRLHVPFSLTSTPASQVAKTRVTGTIYDANLAPDPGGYVTIYRVEKDGVLITDTPRTVQANASGIISFDVPRGSVVFLYGNLSRFNANRGRGTATQIPDAAEVTLESLIPLATVTVGTVTASQVAAEVSARTAADATLQSNINAEASARSSADLALQGNITSEVAARIAAIAAETNARTAADTTLQSNITSEATARAAADTALQSNITSEATARAAAGAAEATARDAAIASASTSDRARGNHTGTQGSATVDYLSPATGAASRSLLDKLGEFRSVKDFGAKGDVVTLPTGGTVSPASNQLSITGATLTGQDNGKTIFLRGAGAASTITGASSTIDAGRTVTDAVADGTDIVTSATAAFTAADRNERVEAPGVVTRIVRIISPSSVQLADPVQVAASNLTLKIGGNVVDAAGRSFGSVVVNNNTTIYSTLFNATSADVGRTIVIVGTGSGQVRRTTISSVNNINQVTVAVAPNWSSSGNTAYIVDSGTGFAPADRNKIVTVPGSGLPAHTYIESVRTPLRAYLSASATSAVADGTITKYANLTTTIQSVAGGVITLATPATSGVTGGFVEWGTNDTAAIENALASGGRVHVPVGKYWVDNPRITVAGTYLFGGGNDSILKLRPGLATGRKVLNVNKTGAKYLSDVTVENLKLDGNFEAYDNGDAENELLNGSNTRRFTVRNVWFEDGQSDGLDVDGDNPGLQIISCRFRRIGRLAIHTYGATGARIIGNQIEQVAEEFNQQSATSEPAAIDINNEQQGAASVAAWGYVSSGPNPVNTLVANNSIRNSGAGIKVNNATTVTLADNQIRNITGGNYPTYSLAGTGIKIATTVTGTVLLNNNTVENTYGDGSYGAGVFHGGAVINAGARGIAIPTGTVATLAGVRVRGTGAEGIYVLGRATIAGGEVSATGTRGVTFDTASTDSTLTGTAIADSGGSGIYILAPVSIKSATVLRSGLKGIYVAATTGAGTTIDGSTVRDATEESIFTLNAANVAVRNNRVFGRAGGTHRGITFSGVTGGVADGNVVTDTALSGIYGTSSSGLTFRNNTVSGVVTALNGGLHINGGANHTIENNSATACPYGLLVGAGTSDSLIAGNKLYANTTADINVSGTVGTGIVWGRNQYSTGFKSHNNGTGTITSAATSVTFSHGVGNSVYPPTAAQVTLTPTLYGAATRMRVSSVTATQITVEVDAAPGTGGATFSWAVDLAR